MDGASVLESYSNSGSGRKRSQNAVPRRRFVARSGNRNYRIAGTDLAGAEGLEPPATVLETGSSPKVSLPRHSACQGATLEGQSVSLRRPGGGMAKQSRRVLRHTKFYWPEGPRGSRATTVPTDPRLAVDVRTSPSMLARVSRRIWDHLVRLFNLRVLCQIAAGRSRPLVKLSLIGRDLPRHRGRAPGTLARLKVPLARAHRDKWVMRVARTRI
jgi:hypothetical protein